MSIHAAVPIVLDHTTFVRTIRGRARDGVRVDMGVLRALVAAADAADVEDDALVAIDGVEPHGTFVGQQTCNEVIVRHTMHQPDGTAIQCE